MLPKQYRLKNHRAFEATYANRKRVSNSFAILYKGKPKTSTDHITKIGFVVTKKVSKRAVKRNRLKRLFREAVRLHLKNNTLPEINDFQSLVFVIKQTENFPNLQICMQTVETLIKRK